MTRRNDGKGLEDYDMQTELSIDKKVARYRPYIASMSVWKGLDRRLRYVAVDSILSIGELRTAPEGRTWCKAGWDSENTGYVLLKGRADVSRSGIGRRICEGPYLFGEMLQFHPNQVRTATIRSVDDCLVLQFSWDEFWREIDERAGSDARAVLYKAIERYAREHFRGIP